MNINNLILAILLFAFCRIGNAQDNTLIDSLNNIINESKNDTVRVKAYINIGDIYEYVIPDSAIFYYNKSLKLAEQINFQKYIGISLSYIGNVKYSQGYYDIAIDYYLKSLKIYDEIDYTRGMSSCYNNIGNIYYYQRSYDLALDYYKNSMKIFEEIDDKKELSGSYNNIGGVYRNLKDYEKAIEFYSKSLNIREELGDIKGMSSSYNNIGIVYIIQGKYDKALEYYHKSMKIFEELNNKSGIAEVTLNIADLNIILADSIALSNKQKENYLNKAVMYAEKTYSIALELKAIPIQNNAAAQLQKAYKKLGNYKDAVKYADIYIATQDSMFNQDKTKALAEMSTKYESEKKQLELDKMQKEKELANKIIEAQQSENRKQLFIIIASISGLIVVLIFSIILLRMFRQKRRANILLSEQKAEIEEKNRDILDSITYAKRIQSAILPQDKLVKEYLKNSFILYKPKDIVAGDFYWMEHKENKILFAVADCTGHGVPGALVSVVCNNGLNRSVREHGLTDPGKILDKTKEIVIQEFEKSDEEVRDGMDIALCSIEGNILEYSGAHNPLWLIRNGELIETKANKQPIGKSRVNEPFTTHTFELIKGDAIYIFSDGYIDQFGGENAKKYKSSSFKELLLSIQDKTMDQQRTILDENFETWRGKLDQIDDVCIIGIKV